MKWRLPARAARLAGEAGSSAARGSVRASARSGARAVLPDADDIAGGIAEERDPQVALRVRLGHDLAAAGSDRLQRLVEVLNEDVDADAVLTGDRVVAAEVADDVPLPSSKAGSGRPRRTLQPKTAS
jgi:hypothetical protein